MVDMKEFIEIVLRQSNIFREEEHSIRFSSKFWCTL